MHSRYFLPLLLLWLCAANAISQPTPIGDVYNTEVVVHAGTHNKYNRTTTTAALIVPDPLPDVGTVNLVFEALPFATNVELSRSAVPNHLHFLFGVSDTLYVKVVEDSYSPSPWRRTQTRRAEIDFNKSQPTAQQTRTIRILDATGQPVTGFDVTVNAYGHGSGNGIKISVPANSNGTINLPIFESDPRTPLPPNSRGPSYGQIEFTHQQSGQIYKVTLPDRTLAKPDVILIPHLDGPGANNITVYEGQVINHNGSPATNTQFSLGFTVPAGTSPGSSRTTETCNIVSPGQNGQFRIAVSSDMTIAQRKNEIISGSVMELGQRHFPTSTHFQLSPGTNEPIRLPKRLTVDAQLIDANGNVITLQSNTRPNHNLQLYKWLPDESAVRRPNFPTSIYPSSGVNGSVFTLDQIPVPGDYYIKYADKQYGPVSVDKTSPTALIQFEQTREDGRYVGLAVDENGSPLVGALVIASKKSIKWQDYTPAQPIIEKLRDKTQRAGLALIADFAPDAYGFAFTGADGKYAFPREDERTFLNLLAIANNRYSAEYNGMTGDKYPLSEDVEIPTVHLPAYAYAAGVAYGPDQVADDDHLGGMKPIPDDASYSVGFWGVQHWFAPSPRPHRTWRYYAVPEEKFPIGTPFRIKVPAGTTCNLRTFASDLHLSMEVWRTTQTLAAGEEMTLPDVTMRAVRPYYLKVLDSEGTRLPGYIFSTLYSNMSKTDSRGVALCYYDEGLAPQVHVYPPRSGSPETFPIQPVDTSTSVPVVTINLSRTKAEMEAHP